MNEAEGKMVSIGMVVRPVPPVRDYFDEQELARLTASIRENGLLVPLLVRPKDDKFEVVDGDRRLKAAWDAGLREIPVLVRALSDSETHIQRMLANLDRHDPDPVSEARYISKVISEGTLTVEEFSEKLGRSEAWIKDRLIIAEMPEYMQVALSAGKIPLGVCLELYEIKEPSTMQRYFDEALRSGMTVHAAHVNRLMVNEAIEGLQKSNEEVTVENVPPPVAVPKVRCELTGEVLPITATRMVRVGIENLNEWRKKRDS